MQPQPQTVWIDLIPPGGEVAEIIPIILTEKLNLLIDLIAN